MTIVGEVLTGTRCEMYPAEPLRRAIYDIHGLCLQHHPWKLGWFMPGTIDLQLPRRACKILEKQ